VKLYDFSLAPNPRRVRMFLAEKGVEIPSVQINTREREQFSEAYKAVSPRCLVPALELDDGTVIVESIAICRYIEELHPTPALFGRDAKERARVEMWSRHAEFDAYGGAAWMVRNGAPMFKDRGVAGVTGGVPQIPALVERGRQTLDRFLHYIDPHLGQNAFLAGERFSVADITAFVAIDFSQRANYERPSNLAHVNRWHGEIAARPSAKA
jgi:glutathione S-transferase